jgi:hypothetical protein
MTLSSRWPIAGERIRRIQIRVLNPRTGTPASAGSRTGDQRRCRLKSAFQTRGSWIGLGEKLLRHAPWRWQAVKLGVFANAPRCIASDLHVFNRRVTVAKMISHRADRRRPPCPHFRAKGDIRPGNGPVCRWTGRRFGLTRTGNSHTAGFMIEIRHYTNVVQLWPPLYVRHPWGECRFPLIRLEPDAESGETWIKDPARPACEWSRICSLN